MTRSVVRAVHGDYLGRVAEIEEKHEVVVRAGDATFVFEADPERRRLVIREEGAAGEVCAITLGDARELAGFVEGLRRVFRATGLAEAASPRRGESSEGEGPPREARRRLPGSIAPDEPEREELIAAARRRNPQAFQPWTPEEEGAVRERYESGESIEAIARDRKRSPRAIEMRLKKMGALPADD